MHMEPTLGNKLIINSAMSSGHNDYEAVYAFSPIIHLSELHNHSVSGQLADIFVIMVSSHGLCFGVSIKPYFRQKGKRETIFHGAGYRPNLDRRTRLKYNKYRPLPRRIERPPLGSANCIRLFRDQRQKTLHP